MLQYLVELVALQIFLDASFMVEYDTDDYSTYLDLVPGYGRYEPKSRFNYGAEYRINGNFSFSLGL